MSSSNKLDEALTGNKQVAPLSTGGTLQFRWYHYALLVSIDMIGPFSTDAYIPALPYLTADLHTTDQLASLTIQLNWFISGVSVVVLGILSDSYGRRPILIAAFIIYIIGTTGCACAKSLPVMLFFRCVQALGEGSAPISSAIIRDVEDDMDRRMVMMSILGALRPIAIIAAPTIGGVIAKFGGWRLVFQVLIGWGCLNLALIVSILTETKNCLDSLLTYSTLKANGSAVLGNRAFTGFAFMQALHMGGTFAMLSNIPFILDGYYNLPEIASGALIGAVPFTGIFVSMLAVKLTKSLKRERMVQLSMVALLFSAVLLLVSALGLYDLGPAPLIVSCMCFVAPLFMLIPAMMTIMLQPFKAQGGLASGAFNMIWKFGGTACAAIVSAAISGTTRPSPQVLMLSIAAMLALSQVLYWGHVRGMVPATEPKQGATDIGGEKGTDVSEGAFVEMKD